MLIFYLRIINQILKINCQPDWLNPSKTELGRISKFIIQNIVNSVKKANHCNLWGEFLWDPLNGLEG